MNINSFLGCWFSGLIFGAWGLSAYKDWSHEGEIIGATTVAFALIVQYFFRKKPSEKPPVIIGETK